MRISMLSDIGRFFQDDDGLTMVEYAIAGSLVGVACILAFTNLGNAITAAINRIISFL